MDLLTSGVHMNGADLSNCERKVHHVAQYILGLPIGTH